MPNFSFHKLLLHHCKCGNIFHHMMFHNRIHIRVGKQGLNRRGSSVSASKFEVFLRLRMQFSKNFEVYWGWGLNKNLRFLRIYPRKTSKFEVRLRTAVLRLRVKFRGWLWPKSLRFFWGFSRKPRNTSILVFYFQRILAWKKEYLHISSMKNTFWKTWLTSIYRWNKFPTNAQ